MLVQASENRRSSGPGPELLCEAGDDQVQAGLEAGVEVGEEDWTGSVRKRQVAGIDPGRAPVQVVLRVALARARLGADAAVPLYGDLLAALQKAAPGGIDIVLDYLGGEPAMALLASFAGHDLHADGRRTRWVQIGESAGASIALPANVLRSSGLELLGSGGGSIPRETMVWAIGEAMPRLFDLAASGSLQVTTAPVPLAEVAAAWDRPQPSGIRLVFTL